MYNAQQNKHIFTYASLQTNVNNSDWYNKGIVFSNAENDQKNPVCVMIESTRMVNSSYHH